VIDDRVEADLSQSVAQLGRAAVKRARFAREIGAKIDYWDRGGGHAGIREYRQFRSQL
jgi:hypothetical protein